jgi:fructokinase
VRTSSWPDSIRGLEHDARPTLPAVLGIGELLWDLFPDGARLGGAPFNVVANLRRLGHRTAFVTAVGDDDLGRAALTAADDLGIDTRFVATVLDLPTGTVRVQSDAAGHRFGIASPAAYESIGDGAAIAARISAWRPDALVFGTLAQRFAGARTLTGEIAARPRTAQRLYDVNLRDDCWSPPLVLDLLALATIVKVNEDEATVLAGILGCDRSATALGEALATRFGTAALCVTRGASGASLWTRDDGARSVDGIRVDAADTVGAGDAFAAGLLHGILTGMPPRDTLAVANRLGALVASRPGALPEWTPAEVGPS